MKSAEDVHEEAAKFTRKRISLFLLFLPSLKNNALCKCEMRNGGIETVYVAR